MNTERERIAERLHFQFGGPQQAARDYMQLAGFVERMLRDVAKRAYDVGCKAGLRSAHGPINSESLVCPADFPLLPEEPKP